MTWVSYAQNGEDVMLMRAFADLPQGFYVDVGAQDPRADSVTRAFYERGWHGINLDPVPHWHARLCADRPRDLCLAVAAASRAGVLRLWEVEGTGLSTADPRFAQHQRDAGRATRACDVPAMRLDDILRDAGASEIHFLKIDVEGAERDVLEGIDLRRFRPWVVLVEATEPGSTRAAHAQWEGLLLGADYEMVWFDGLNRFYLARERAARRPAFASPPNVFDDYIRYSEWLARQDVATLHAELAQARAALASAGVEADAARAGAAADRADAAAARTYAQAMRAEADQAGARIAALIASRSWRVTAPLRSLGRGLRALARRLSGAGRARPTMAPVTIPAAPIADASSVRLMPVDPPPATGAPVAGPDIRSVCPPPDASLAAALSDAPTEPGDPIVDASPMTVAFAAELDRALRARSGS